MLAATTKGPTPISFAGMSNRYKTLAEPGRGVFERCRETNANQSPNTLHTLLILRTPDNP